jgi:hypothetical protein
VGKREDRSLHRSAMAALASAPLGGIVEDTGLPERARFSRPNLLARFLASPLFNGSGASAITLGHTVYILRDDIDLSSPEGVSLLVHELKHVEQFEREGWVKFLAGYFWDYVRYGYGEGIRLEREAIEAERKALAAMTGALEEVSDGPKA